jgi:acetylornithine/succinyldiaminopimelate/putrescine aminotransferase
MSLTDSNAAAFWAEAESLFPRSRLEQLRATGLDIIEGRREGPYVYDESGQRYLDAFTSAGVYNLGRSHPELVEALRQSMRETDIGNFPIISEQKARLAEALAEFVPGPVECSIFGVTRGEAMDAACKIARGYTRRAELLSVDGGWYGQTGFALSLSERPDRDLYGPLIPDVRSVPFGDLDAARAAINSQTAAVILEPVQAENHCRAATPEYLRGLADLCRMHDALLVADETQTGFGRTGRRFAFEESGVHPDIVLLGEALGGGLFPVSVTMITPRVNTFLNAHPMIHLSTFGGADLGCLVACKALEIYQREQPWRNAAAMGKRLRTGLDRLCEEPDSRVRGVEGQGFLLSLDLGTAAAAQGFCWHTRRCGVLAAPGQVARHTVVVRPSLLITEAQTEELLDALRAAAGRTGVA